MKKFLISLLLLFASGCMSQQTLDARIKAIEQKHSVTIRADNGLSRCGLFGDLSGLLNQIDSDLDKCSYYFKTRIGPIIIEEFFSDNEKAYPLPLLLRGYVNTKEEGWPIHIKNRSLFEKILLWAPRDEEVFLHEASHSFEFNMGTNYYTEWLEFYNDFGGGEITNYGGIVTSLVVSIFPPLGFLRPAGMPTFYGSTSHFEDFAETHCYLHRHGDIEFLKTKDRRLYEKCKALKKLVNGEYQKKYASSRNSP